MLVWQISGSANESGCEMGGCMVAGENRDLILFKQAMAAPWRRYHVEGIAVAATVHPLALLRGKPQIPDFPGRTMATLSVSLYLLGASFLEQMLDRGCKMWSGVHLPR